MSVARLSNVSCYQHRVKKAGWRLRGVTAEFEPGVTALLGPSGSGKTTLLNLLAGFEKADAGEVVCEKESGWQPANGGLWPELTMREHLEVRGKNRPALPKKTVDDWLEAFDLLPLTGRRPPTLSQGETMRLSVARALASEAKLILLDEPLAHVDERSRRRYWALIQERVKASGATLVFATHQASEVLGQAERVVCLRDGEVVWQGRVGELYDNAPDEESAWFLGAVNWFNKGEAEVWGLAGAPACLRPERLAVEIAEGNFRAAAPSSDGFQPSRAGFSDLNDGWKPSLLGAPPFKVRDHRFAGVHSETVLQGETERSFFHVARRPLPTGATVTLRWLGLLFCCLFLLGCHGGENGAALQTKSWLTWSLPPFAGKFPAPRSVTIGLNHEVVVLDTAGRILFFDPQGQLLRSWNMPESSVGRPEGVRADYKTGQVIVSDTHYHRVVIFAADGTVARMIGSEGHDKGQFIYPVAVEHGPDGGWLIAEYGGNDRVQYFDKNWNFQWSLGAFGVGTGDFQRPSGLCRLPEPDGRLLVADAINNRLSAFSTSERTKEPTFAAGVSLNLPYDLGLTKAGNLVVVEYGAGRLTWLSPDGALLARFGSPGRGENQFSTPWGMTVDKETGRIYVADTGNRRVVALEFGEGAP